jgi:hypothetical protein
MKLRQLRDKLVQHKKIIAASTVGILGAAALVASGLYFAEKKKERKESRVQTSTAVRVMTTMQALLGTGFMVTNLFGENAMVNNMRDIVNNSFLMTRIVQYFESLRQELGIIRTVKKEDQEIEIGGRKLPSVTVYLKDFFDKTRGPAEWFWAKYDKEVSGNTDIDFISWLKEQESILNSLPDALKTWCKTVISENSTSTFKRLLTWARHDPRPKVQNLSQIAGEDYDEEFADVVTNIKECLMIKSDDDKKEALFAPVIRSTKGKTILNWIILSIPALSIAIVKFCWIQRNFSPARVVAMIATCFVVLFLTLLDPVKEMVEDIQIVDLAQLNALGDDPKESLNKPECDILLPVEYYKEGVNRHGGKRWRGPTGGTHQRRHFKRITLSDAEYKALEEKAKRNGMNVGALVRAAADNILGYDEEYDDYAYNSLKDAEDDDYRHSQDPDEFYAMLNRTYHKHDILGENPYEQESAVRAEIKKLTDQLSELRKEMQNVKQAKIEVDKTAIKSTLDKQELENLKKTKTEVEELRKEFWFFRDTANKQRVQDEEDNRAKVGELIHLRSVLAQLQANKSGKSVDDELTAIKLQIAELAEHSKGDFKTEIMNSLNEIKAKQLQMEDKQKDEKKESTDSDKEKEAKKVADQNNKALPFICAKCKKGFAKMKPLKNHQKTCIKDKERANVKYPAADTTSLRKAYLEIEVLVEGNWVHQGGAVATTDGNGTHAYSVHHNVETFKTGDVRDMEVRARIPDVLDANKTIRTFPVKVLQMDKTDKLDVIIFELPNNIPSDELHRVKVHQVPEDATFVQITAIRWTNGKKEWCDPIGHINFYNYNSFLIEYQNSTLRGDSGSPVFAWDEKTQKWQLVALHMQAGDAGSMTNEGRLLSGLAESGKLFRA